MDSWNSDLGMVPWDPHRLITERTALKPLFLDGKGKREVQDFAGVNGDGLFRRQIIYPILAALRCQLVEPNAA